MTAVFEDMEQCDSPINGARISTDDDLEAMLKAFDGRKPFLFALHGANGTMLTVGWAHDCGSVQYSAEDGSPPYLMALEGDALTDEGYVEFLVCHTPTPIPKRFCLSRDCTEKVIRDFVVHGRKSEVVQWEEI